MTAAQAPGRLSILTFTIVFPRPGEPNLGLFVRARAAAIARRAEVHVVAPVALVEYGNPAGMFPKAVPATRQESGMSVAHPRWFYLPSPQALAPLLLFLGAWTAVRRARPFDVIDAHFGHPTACAAALLARATGRPFTVTLRGSEPVHARSRTQRALLAWALRRAARVIAVSSRLREFALSLGVNPARAVTIPNGIDADVFYPRDRAACRARLQMADSTQHVLSVGYLIELKGHHHPIEAVARLRAAGRAVELWIIGNAGRGATCEAELHALAARLGIADAVHFVSAVPHATLAEYFSAADILCLASSHEGSPNVVNEALACGTPVVAFDVGGVADRLSDPALRHSGPERRCPGFAAGSRRRARKGLGPRRHLRLGPLAHVGPCGRRGPRAAQGRRGGKIASRTTRGNKGKYERSPGTDRAGNPHAGGRPTARAAKMETGRPLRPSAYQTHDPGPPSGR